MPTATGHVFGVGRHHSGELERETPPLGGTFWGCVGPLGAERRVPSAERMAAKPSQDIETWHSAVQAGAVRWATQCLEHASSA